MLALLGFAPAPQRRGEMSDWKYYIRILHGGEIIALIGPYADHETAAYIRESSVKLAHCATSLIGYWQEPDNEGRGGWINTELGLEGGSNPDA